MGVASSVCRYFDVFYDSVGFTDRMASLRSRLLPNVLWSCPLNSKDWWKQLALCKVMYAGRMKSANGASNRRGQVFDNRLIFLAAIGLMTTEEVEEVKLRCIA